MHERDLAVFSLAYEASRRARAVEKPLSEVSPHEAEQFAATFGEAVFRRAEKEVSRLESLGLDILSVLSQRYPPQLKAIAGAPAVLYLRGVFNVGDPVIAIVGSRSASREGREFAFSLAREIAEAGGTVVSGLAYGCDAAAHRGAIAARSGNAGLAILGGGVLRVYPEEHSALADEMIRNGGSVLSEAHPDETPRRGYFPARNRIISGLSLATVIVEADEKSGSLITARFAAEQGREVFAVPGSISSPRSKGTNNLLRDGARILTGVGDLEGLFKGRPGRKASSGAEIEGDSLLTALRDGDLSFDELRDRLGLPVHDLMSAITNHELEGRIRCADGSVGLIR